MLAQNFPRPYDVWLADEDPSPATRAWCAESDVQLSCRKGVPGYNNPSWPRREKCKEGNLAYFYEVMGGYATVRLRRATRRRSRARADVPDRDGAALRRSAVSGMWPRRACATRMRRAPGPPAAACTRKPPLHGPLQAGYNGGLRSPVHRQPLCGAHPRRCATLAASVPSWRKTSAPRVLMNAGGWRGAFAIDAAASGDGPPVSPTASPRSSSGAAASPTSSCRCGRLAEDRLPFRRSTPARLWSGLVPAVHAASARSATCCPSWHSPWHTVGQRQPARVPCRAPQSRPRLPC